MEDNQTPTEPIESGEPNPNRIKITFVKNGPARVECEEAEIVLPSGEKMIKQQIVSICRCACSKRKPFCDGAHKAFKFEK